MRRQTPRGIIGRHFITDRRERSIIVGPMLGRWLAPTPVAEFLAAYLHKQPHARPGSALLTAETFGWSIVDRLLAASPPDALVIARGKTEDAPVPRSLPELRALMGRGLGVVIRKSERHDPVLAQLALAFAGDLPGEVHLQVFVTPAETHGFGWHYDFEDVFIVQTEGVKDYFFRANTVDLLTPREVQPNFELYQQERSPMGTARLLRGDWLYLPARWWHAAKAVEDSLSISVGVTIKKG
jgi:50S ribosomal protein L16 3-hydroxylase